MATTKELIEHLRDLDPTGNAHMAASIWQVEDVRDRAREMRVKLTKTQVDGILDTIHDKWDAELGINWGLIDFYVDDVGTPYKSRRKGG